MTDQNALFQRLPQARENEARLRVAQSRRDQIDAFAELRQRTRRQHERSVMLARVGTGLAMLGVLVLATLGHFS